MQYLSTRGGPTASFEDVLLGGTAPNGGLYLPQNWPQFTSRDVSEFASLPYAEVAVRILAPFAESLFSADELREAARDAYAGFGHAAVAPLVQLAPEDRKSVV